MIVLSSINRQININKLDSMVRYRSWERFQCKNGNFIGVVGALFLSYILFNYEFFFSVGNVGVMFYAILLLYLLSMWSYFTAVLTDPGKVPSFYGVYSQNVSGQRKYCLICHNFKPQRAHHCSRCKQCVLNMDHHCPWLNNCVGFDNRKYFVLFITYLTLALILAVIPMVMVLIHDFTVIFSGKTAFTFNTAIRIIVFLFYSAMALTLIHFTYTHFRYICTNTTTLEDLVLQQKRKDDQFRQTQRVNQYDISCSHNFTQVFGDNPFYWAFPLEAEQPLRGRGIIWDRNDPKEETQ